MNHKALFSTFLVAILCGSLVFDVSCKKRDKNKEDGRGQNRDWLGSDKRGRGFGRGGNGPGFCPDFGILGYLMKDSKKVRKEIKIVGDKIKKLNKFRRECFSGKKTRFEDKTFRMQHAEKMYNKAQELGLTLDGTENLRKLNDLSLEERLAINLMESELITIQLRKQGGGECLFQPNKSEKSAKRGMDSKARSSDYFVEPEPESQEHGQQAEPEYEPEF